VTGHDPTAVPTVPPPAPPSAWRAWRALVWFSWQRQARARQMVWIALALLGFSLALVTLNTTFNGWSMLRWRHPRGAGPTYRDWLLETWAVTSLAGRSPEGAAAPTFLIAAYAKVIEDSGLHVFTRSIVFSIFVSFLLPVWSLSFATESFGGEREGNSLIWLLTRPLPRWSVYLAKFVAMLPWSLGLNLGGFVLLCLAGGKPGLQALALFWPAVFWGTMAFSALFLLIGACFRRPAVVAVLYSFFLETLLGNMPGYLKRVSINFYVRCMMFDVARDHGIPPDNPTVFLPVDGWTAWLVLVGLTVGLLGLGMYLFTKKEYVSVE
jgi:ABC-type transport system involved in multi-copper enzyme maturation permease subunit